MHQFRDQSAYRHAPCFGGLESISAQFARHRFAPHFHDTYVIGVTETGYEAYVQEGRSAISGPGGVRMIAPGEAHSGGPADERGWRYSAFYPSVAVVRQAAGLDPEGPAIMFKPQARDEIGFKLVRQAVAALTSPAGRLEQEDAVFAALAHLTALYGDAEVAAPARAGRAQIQRAYEEMRERLAEDVTLGDLAETAGLSVFALVRGFRKAYGLPPAAMLIQMRVERAKQMLRAGAPPATVAHACGFYDQSHLNRMFKARVGASPGSYARAVA